MMFIGTFTQAGAYKFFFVKYILVTIRLNIYSRKAEKKNMVKPKLIWVRYYHFQAPVSFSQFSDAAHYHWVPGHSARPRVVNVTAFCKRCGPSKRRRVEKIGGEWLPYISPISTMGTLLAVHPIVPWLKGSPEHFGVSTRICCWFIWDMTYDRMMWFLKGHMTVASMMSPEMATIHQGQDVIKTLENPTMINHSILYMKYIQNEVEQPQMTIGFIQPPKISWSNFTYIIGGFSHPNPFQHAPPSSNLVKTQSCPPCISPSLAYTSTFAGHMGHMGQRAFDTCITRRRICPSANTKKWRNILVV